MNDPCDCVEEIDLSRDDDCVKVLLRDKHTRLEGLCAELLFLEDLVDPVFKERSEGWWISSSDGRSFNVVHVVDRGSLTSTLDEELYSRFLEKRVIIDRWEFDCTSNLIQRMRLHRARNGTVAHGPLINKPTSEKRIAVASDAERDRTRSLKAIDFLRERGALQKAAKSRLIANCFFKKGWLWDVDAIVRDRAELIAFETKQKYPSSNGSFGINQGLSKVFGFLHDSGLRVIHVILTKPIWSREMSAVDLMAIPKYKEQAMWIATEGRNSCLE